MQIPCVLEKRRLLAGDLSKAAAPRLFTIAQRSTKSPMHLVSLHVRTGIGRGRLGAWRGRNPRWYPLTRSADSTAGIRPLPITPHRATLNVSSCPVQACIQQAWWRISKHRMTGAVGRRLVFQVTSYLLYWASCRRSRNCRLSWKNQSLRAMVGSACAAWKRHHNDSQL